MRPGTLNDLLDSAAAGRPGAVGLVALQGESERAVTFAEFRALVMRCASALRSSGVSKGDAFALLHRNGLEFVTLYFALARLGAVAVPLNFLIQKPEELGFMLGHCGAKGVLTQREFLPGLLKAKSLPGLQGLQVWVSDPEVPAAGAVPSGKGPSASGSRTGGAAFWPLVESAAPLEEAPPVSPDDIAAVLYTSGTTGHPKGVMLSHGNMFFDCESSIDALGLRGRQGVMVTILPLFHTFGWTACVLVPLSLMVKNVLSPSVTPPKLWLSLMARHKASLLCAVPQLYSVLVKQATGFKRLALRYWYFRNVKFFVSGAAPLSRATMEQFESAFGVPILEGYGLTETSPVACFNRLDARRPGSVGLPIPGVELRVVDDRGLPLPAGQEGEVLIKGPNIMKGYLRDPEATSAAISPEGWLKTGDIGLLDADGYLHIRDRKKDMIIVKGLKVFSAQVEAVLSSFPDVEEAAVVGIPDEHGDETIKAFVVLRRGVPPDRSAFLAACRAKLDPYKRPRDVEFLDALPKNSLQKVLKRELRDTEAARIRERRGGG